MFNDYQIETILNKNNSYKLGYILIMISLIFIYIILTYKYESYYLAKGIIKDNYLVIKVYIEDIKYLDDNHFLYIDNKKHFYQVKGKSKLYVDNNYKNYRYLYLDIYEITKEDNCVYTIKIIKESKTLVKYLSDI